VPSNFINLLDYIDHKFVSFVYHIDNKKERGKGRKKSKGKKIAKGKTENKKARKSGNILNLKCRHCNL
jgi:hypothetical protein